MSSHDMEEEEGTEEGRCPFTVHGLTGDEFTMLSMTALKACALKHLEDQGKTLGIGHEHKPQSLYDNPQAYPQMFPWLFPYGYGGIGQARLKKKISETEHKKHLLMYHDKRFQTDLYFPIVAFNHEQLKAEVLVTVPWDDNTYHYPLRIAVLVLCNVSRPYLCWSYTCKSSL